MGKAWQGGIRRHRLVRPIESLHRLLLAFALAPSGEIENKATGDLSAPEFVQGLVRIGKRARCYLATHFAGSSNCKNLPHVLSGADGGSLDTNFSGGHQDREKTYRISRQAHHQENTRGPQAIERRVIGCARC